LEEKSERSRTGFLGDPNHKVPYINHPYDKENRDLQETESSNFQPMRIQFETKALDDRRDSSNAAKIDFIKNEILAKTATFWSKSLSVVRVNGNLKVSSAELDNREYCGDSEFTSVPSEHISTGVANTDLLLYVSGAPSSRFCSGTTLAVAVACNFDQFDRPTAGAINICMDQIELDDDGTASDAVVEDNVDVLIHEVAHVLGHSSNSYRFFWDSETGLERTARPFESRTVTCVDNVDRTLILPDDNTMKFFQANNGQRYAAIVTPKVRAVARNQFDCQSLEGAKLENQPTGSDSCTGDHWDEHDYYPEAMSGVISPTTNILSHLTLALMEDSGWYRANYTQGGMNPWGLGAGCDFVEGPCVTQDPTTLQPILPKYAEGYFCTEGSARGCSPALTHKMACTVIDYFYILPRALPEDRYQYFPAEPTKGGPRQADFCPLYGSTYGGMEAERLACGDTRNADSINIYR
jgi:leishmanolysin-like peptidase